EDTMPTMIEAEIPRSEVLSQNNKNKIAGKLAEAAIANAQPTKKDTLIPLKAMPSNMANIPTAKAEIFPALTFAPSLKFFLRQTSIKSCAIAPEEATINPAT